MGKGRRKDGEAKEGYAETMAFYGKTFISQRVALRVRRSLLYLEQKTESAFAEDLMLQSCRPTR